MSKVTWAQHGHIPCAHNTHLFGELGHAPAMKIFETVHSEIASEAFLATNTTLSAIPVFSLYVHMKAIAHAKN